MSDTLNKMSMDEFRRQQKEVLASWPTGKDVNFQEAVDYHKSLPDSKVFSKKLEQARKEAGSIVEQAENDAARLREESRQKARDETAALLAQAQKEAERQAEGLRDKTEKQCAQIAASAESNMEKAVKFIMERVVG